MVHHPFNVAEALANKEKISAKYELQKKFLFGYLQSTNERDPQRLEVKPQKKKSTS
jgi:hypothetical protein